MIKAASKKIAAPRDPARGAQGRRNPDQMTLLTGAAVGAQTRWSVRSIIAPGLAFPGVALPAHLT
jgi:hypothetical protein